MTVAAFEGKVPRLGRDTYVHPSADVFGDVDIGAGCWIGPGARIRGDYAHELHASFLDLRLVAETNQSGPRLWPLRRKSALNGG